jgi:NitT/TauT family transport system substrate-binding protein
MMNEINKLVWPAPDGIGALDQDVLAQTIATATEAGILAAEPDDAAFNSAIREEAWAGLSGDTTGEGWESPTVEITPQGQ